VFSHHTLLVPLLSHTTLSIPHFSHSRLCVADSPSLLTAHGSHTTLSVARVHTAPFSCPCLTQDTLRVKMQVLSTQQQQQARGAPGFWPVFFKRQLAKPSALTTRPRRGGRHRLISHRYSVCLLYWYQSTNTDTCGAAASF
jgi:hypothetical protein